MSETRLWLVRHAPVAAPLGVIYGPDAPADISSAAAISALQAILPLGATTVAPSDYARYCDLSISLFQEITKLPSREAASVLREMFSES